MRLKTNKESFLTSNIYRIAFFSALLIGLCTHLFGLLIPMHNADNIVCQSTGYGADIESGRWFLYIVGTVCYSLGGIYNLPWINGLIFLAFLAVSSCFLISALNIRHKFSAVLISAMMVVFPAVTSTLYYRFTAPYYGLAILLAIFAAWICDRCRFSFVISAVCTALSLGIYQAYTPITIGIFILILIRQVLNRDADYLHIIRKSLFYCGTLILGLALYAVCLKLMLNIFDLELTDYKGISQMGSSSISQLLSLTVFAFKNFFKITCTDYYGLSGSPVTQKLYLLLMLVSLAIVVYLQITHVKKAGISILAGLLCLTFPIAANFIVVMCPDGVYTLMLYGFVIVACFPLVVWECLYDQSHLPDIIKQWSKKGIAIALSVIMMFYAYEANISYASMYYSTQQAENYVASMVAQIRMTEGFTVDKKWALLGIIEDPLLFSPWETDTRFGGNLTTGELLNSYSRMSWFESYVGYSIPMHDQEITNALAQTDVFKNMPCWPNAGSIQIIDDTVVVKFSEYVEGSPYF